MWVWSIARLLDWLSSRVKNTHLSAIELLLSLIWLNGWMVEYLVMVEWLVDTWSVGFPLLLLASTVNGFAAKFGSWYVLIYYSLRYSPNYSQYLFQLLLIDSKCCMKYWTYINDQDILYWDMNTIEYGHENNILRCYKTHIGYMTNVRKNC